MELSPKLLPLYGVVPLVFMIGYVVYYGRAYRTSKGTPALGAHRGGINCVMWLMALSIGLIEMGLRTGAPGPYPALFWIHLPLAVAFLLLFLAIRVRFNGHRSASHGVLAYACVALFGATLLTGGIMLWRL
jgi:hypothetical protein